MYITELQSFKVFFLILFKICGGTLRILYLSIVNHSLNNTTFIDIACLLTKDLYIYLGIVKLALILTLYLKRRLKRIITVSSNSLL